MEDVVVPSAAQVSGLLRVSPFTMHGPIEEKFSTRLVLVVSRRQQIRRGKQNCLLERGKRGRGPGSWGPRKTAYSS